MTTAQAQLPLGIVDPTPAPRDAWHLDPRTRAMNRRGIAKARALLAQAARRAELREAERTGTAAA